MKHKVGFFFVLSFVVALMLLNTGVHPAHAASSSFLSFNSIGCTNGATDFNWTSDLTGSQTFRTIVSAGGNIYMDEQFTGTQSFPTDWGLFNSNSGGTQNAFFPLPSSTTINVTLSYGSTSFSFSFVCSGSVAVIPGPPIPVGFALRTITCDVSVFDAPAGQAVPGARIKGGQTWYVNLKPIIAKNGVAWTELFAGGIRTGYVPTKCVG